ncbi:MAG: hypothetical protein ACOVMH_02255 [Flavobacterium sp.]|jgi:xanthine/uracil permease
MAIDLLKNPNFLADYTQQQLITENNDLKKNNLIYISLFLLLGLSMVTLIVINNEQEKKIKILKYNGVEL